MKVTLIASTAMYNIPESVEGTVFADYFYSDSDALRNDSDTLAHFAGRSCYQEWRMPNEATSDNMGYLANILNQGHESVLEHGSATFYIEGVSRNLTHELIRHRHLSYSELSQRFVNMEEANFVVPPANRVEGITAPQGLCPITEYGDAEKEEIPATSLDQHPLKVYVETVKHLLGLGKSRKQAREAARFYLPSGMETRIVVSGNHRAWRDMLKKRYSVHADAEIMELAGILLEKLRDMAPGIYQDFPTQPFE